MQSSLSFIVSWARESIRTICVIHTVYVIEKVFSIFSSSYKGTSTIESIWRRVNGKRLFLFTILKSNFLLFSFLNLLSLFKIKKKENLLVLFAEVSSFIISKLALLSCLNGELLPYQLKKSLSVSFSVYLNLFNYFESIFQFFKSFQNSIFLSVFFFC